MTDLSDYQQVLTPNYGLPPKIIVRGQGCELFGQSNERYLDLAGGIAVSALGHCHPDIVKALTEQANKVWHLSNVLANEPAIELAKALVAATFADRVFFCNSGAEANEAAIKAAIGERFRLRQSAPTPPFSKPKKYIQNNSPTTEALSPKHPGELFPTWLNHHPATLAVP